MDWDQLLREANHYLQEYLQIETVNPPGNEIEGARFFKKIFDRESIPCQIFEPSPGRGSLLATFKGSGVKRPLLLLNHIDVVLLKRSIGRLILLKGSLKTGLSM